MTDWVQTFTVIGVFVGILTAIATIAGIRHWRLQVVLGSLLAVISFAAIVIVLMSITKGTDTPPPPRPSPGFSPPRPSPSFEGRVSPNPTPLDTVKAPDDTPVETVKAQPIDIPSVAVKAPVDTPSVTVNSHADTPGSAGQEVRARIVAVASDQSGAEWTTDITAREIENALVQYDRVATVLRSTLQGDEKRKLADPNLAQVCHVAKDLGIRYVVVGRCLKAEEDNFMNLQIYLDVVVQIELVDVESGRTVLSQGFKDRTVTQTVVVGASKESKQIYSGMMKRFAHDFIERIARVLK